LPIPTLLIPYNKSMKYKTHLTTLLAWVVVGVFACTAQTTSRAEELKVQAQLIWGTNEKESPDAKHQPVDAEVAKKLKQLPLKWDHYFVVKKLQVDVPVNGTKKEALSEKCAIEIKDEGSGNVEISLFGKGHQVVKRKQQLPKGEVVVLGGNAPNETAWLVVLKRTN
jgi:hypothetical protein